MKALDFGDYCNIEQKRYGCDNQMYRYKVISSGKANYYRAVPVDGRAQHNSRGDMCGIVKAICCGISEDKIETFRICDVKRLDVKRGEE